MSMGGIYRGLVADALAILEATGADVWVVQQGTSGPFAATSRMPEDLKYRIRAVPGVSQASPLSFQNIQLERFGEPFRFFLVGYEPGGLGGPPAIVEGRGIGQKHYELVADRAMGLAVGERFAIAGDVYTVVGLTRKMVSSSGDPVAWVTLEDAQKIQFKEDNNAIRNNRARVAARVAGKGLPPVQAEQAAALAEEFTGSTHIVNTVVARLAPGAEAARVRAAIGRWNHLRAISNEEQTTILTEGMIKKAKMQLGLFRAILLVISAVIISLIIYTSTLDKIRTIATLKLIGAKNRVIVGLILQQSILMGVIAYAIGYVLISLTQEKFPRRVELLATDLRLLFLIVVAICVAASMVGIRKALKVEAADALNS
jgi:putative ABC transport system permease protein